MDIESKSWLYDIINAIDEIDMFLSDQQYDFQAYIRDIRTRRAVERNIEIIGEAVNRLLNRNPHVELTHARKIVDTRNRIIHGYDTVSNEVIWGIVTQHLQVLKDESEKLLNQ